MFKNSTMVKVIKYSLQQSINPGKRRFKDTPKINTEKINEFKSIQEREEKKNEGNVEK